MQTAAGIAASFLLLPFKRGPMKEERHVCSTPLCGENVLFILSTLTRRSPLPLPLPPVIDWHLPAQSVWFLQLVVFGSDRRGSLSRPYFSVTLCGGCYFSVYPADFSLAVSRPACILAEDGFLFFPLRSFWDRGPVHPDRVPLKLRLLLKKTGRWSLFFTFRRCGFAEVLL